MSFAAGFLDLATTIAFVAFVIAGAISVLRVLIGPSLPDRILGLDMLSAVAIGFIAVFAIRSRQALYVDIAIALALVAFLATVAFARYVLRRAAPEDAS